jgi:hypothetical protein
MNPLPALTAALLAYVEWVRWQREREIDQLEDEIDRLAATGDAASKLRIERLAQRRKRKLAVRSADSDPTAE